MARVWQVLLILLTAGSSVPETAKPTAKQRIIPLPSGLIHPNMLGLVDEGDYESLLEHGHVLAEFGAKLAVYGRPACEVASWFVCYDTADTSHAALSRWIPEAVRLLGKAAQLRPDNKKPYILLINAHSAASNFSAALDVYEQHCKRPELHISADDRTSMLNSMHVHTTRNCRWEESSRTQRHIKDLVFNANTTMPAMHWIEIPGVNAQHAKHNIEALSKKIEEEVAPDVAHFEPKSIAMARKAKSYKDKLRVGFVSAKGFQRYTTTDAMLGYFLARSRDSFFVVCYAGIGDDGSGQRDLTRQNCDKFVEAGGMAPAQLAAQVRDDDVHILVDLHGYTLGTDTVWAGLPPFRQAPIQVHFHGQPQTTGSRHINFYVSDPITSPPEFRAHYTEKLVMLPDHYLCTSLSASHGEFWAPATKHPPHVSRKAFKFKSKDVLLAYFGQPYKIEPRIWECWMRILQRCPSAKLWLFRFPIQGFGGHDIGPTLREAASKAGVDTSRIRVSALFPKQDELASKQLADVFLDTPLFNAHTTAADALYAGLPILTLPADLHTSRVAASLALASGSTPFIARDLREYEDIAVALVRRARVRRRLRLAFANKMRASPPVAGSLWDVKAFVTAFEAALRMLWDAAVCAGVGKHHVIVNSQSRDRVLREFGFKP